MEVIPPNKDMLKTVDEILAQNRKIIEINSVIINVIYNPQIAIDEEKQKSNDLHRIEREDNGQRNKISV